MLRIAALLVGTLVAVAVALPLLWLLEPTCGAAGAGAVGVGMVAGVFAAAPFSRRTRRSFGARKGPTAGSGD